MANRYEVRNRGKQFIVYDTKKKVYITKAIPDKEVAEEIAEDFNKMSKGNYTPIGGIDNSKNVN